MIKKECKDCGKTFEIPESHAWKTHCIDCFKKAINIKIGEKPTPYQEIKQQEKAEKEETKKRIMFGNCLNASGMALSGSGTTPKQHYDYAKELFEIWIKGEVDGR